MAKVFISYRRGDSAGHTGRLVDSLESRFGREAFFRDIEDLEPGVDFPAALDRALSESSAMLVMIGPSWASATGEGGRRLEQEGDFVRIEVATALARHDVRTIPVLVGGAMMPGREEVPADLETLLRRNAIEISDTRWDYDVQRLGDTLAKHLGLQETVVAAPPEKKGMGLFGKLGIGVAAAAVLVVAVQLLSGSDEAPGSGQEQAVESPIGDTERPVAAGDAAPSVDTFDVAGLTWTIDDRHATLDWNAASAYCDALTAGGRTWRLPTIDDLSSIADPKDPDAFDKKMLRPFHGGVTSNWIWSADMDTAGAAFAFDFKELSKVSLAVNFDKGAHGLCVSE